MKPGQTATSVVHRSIFSWAFTGNLKIQLLLLLAIVITVFARVLPLEMQKRIINEAIGLRQFDLLLRYCGIYLASVVLAGGLKYVITGLQSLLGERVMAQLRKDLYHHILTLPLTFFRKTQPGMVVSSLINELNTTGTFAGMALGVPLINILTLLAFAGYLFWLHPLLAVISLSIYPLVLVLVPLVQRGANRLNKERVDVSRTLADRIAESINGIHEIQANAAFGTENDKFDRLTDRLRGIRVRWNLFRNGVKVLNNFLNSLGPFLIFIVGGYLAMRGQLELGSLVAFLSAQEKLYDPWKEMIEFYDVYQDASVRHKRVMEAFDAQPEFRLLPGTGQVQSLGGGLEVQELSFVTPDGIRLLDRVSMRLAPGEHLALVGFSGSGKSTLAQCIGQLYRYSEGHVLLGGQEVAELSKADLAANLGFVSQTPFVFSGTIEDNLLYACKALRAVTTKGCRPELDDLIEVLQQTGIFLDVLRFGLNTIIDRQEHQALAQQLVRVRESFQCTFGQELAASVEFFDQERYLFHSSVADNITFGTANRQELAPELLADNPYFLRFLADNDLSVPLVALAEELASQTISILGELPADDLFFEESPLAASELPVYRQLLEARRGDAAEQRQLVRLALRFIPARHKMARLGSRLESLILASRQRFKSAIQQDDPGAFAFYQATEYIFSQTIQSNIFFGKIKRATPQVQERVHQSIIHLLIEEDLLETILQIGMQFQVGSKGDNLSGGQRQKVAIARAFLKRPPVLILDEATSALDNKSQARIQHLLETRWKGRSTVIAVVHRLDIVKSFDRVAVMKAGKVVEMGPYDELLAKKGILYELVHGKR
ncbi:MAG: ABC transporter ATP-binding protein/permease [Thermodesulfobacteriota bacterium]